MILIKNVKLIPRSIPALNILLSKSVTTTTNKINQDDPLVLIERENNSNYLTLKLNNKPANTLGLEFINELITNLDKIEQDKTVKGVILTSNLKNIYSAGLELTEVYKLDQSRCRVFWRALQTLWIKLYGSNKVFIGAINGHAPAGGCLLSLTCDYRIMANGAYKIGLNETLLGIQPPFWLCNAMINTIGFRNGEKACHFGELYSSQEALKLNLVDKIVDQKDLQTESEKTMKEWLKIPEMARIITKSEMRKISIEKLINVFDSEADARVDFLAKDFTQKNIEKYFMNLKKKNKT